MSMMHRDYAFIKPRPWVALRRPSTSHRGKERDPRSRLYEEPEADSESKHPTPNTLPLRIIPLGFLDDLDEAVERFAELGLPLLEFLAQAGEFHLIRPRHRTEPPLDNR